MNPGPSLPNDSHIFRMTDDTGIFQHSKYAVPDPRFGYTADDNARALIMAVMLHEATGDLKYLGLVSRYLGFLYYAKTGRWFRNFMDYGRRFLENRGSHDCFGRCVWALGYAASAESLPSGFRSAARHLLEETVDGCRDLRHLRSMAYAVLGLCAWNPDHGYIKALSGNLQAAYEASSGEDWRWFEDKMTYCNAIMPLAMLEAGRVTKNARLSGIGLESLDFLIGTTFSGGVFRPVGCNGWLVRGEKAARYDQQPVEACETLLACLKAFELTGDLKYREMARLCLEWFLGRNDSGKKLVDESTGGCFDGITAHGLNENMGAESLISWWIALLSWRKAAGGSERSSEQWIDLSSLTGYLRSTISGGYSARN